MKEAQKNLTEMMIIKTMNKDSTNKIKIHLSTSSVDKCIQGLKFIYNQFQTILEDSYNWKWIILALDNTVQNFMVYALRDSAGVNILKEKIRDAYYNSLRYNTKRT